MYVCVCICVFVCDGGPTPRPHLPLQCTPKLDGGGGGGERIIVLDVNARW